MRRTYVSEAHVSVKESNGTCSKSLYRNVTFSQTKSCSPSCRRRTERRLRIETKPQFNIAQFKEHTYRGIWNRWNSSTVRTCWHESQRASMSLHFNVIKLLEQRKYASWKYNTMSRSSRFSLCTQMKNTCASVKKCCWGGGGTWIISTRNRAMRAIDSNTCEKCHS